MTLHIEFIVNIALAVIIGITAVSVLEGLLISVGKGFKKIKIGIRRYLRKRKRRIK